MSFPVSPAFTAVAPHYDALMRDVPYRSWVRYLHRLLDARKATPKRILDLACGTGNVSEILAEEGYEVVGVDLSEGMIDQARRKARKRSLPVEYHVQDAARLELPGPAFDLCISLFDSLNYILDPDALASAISRVFAHLQPGGLFVFDVNSAFSLENGFFDQENMLSNERLRYVWRSAYDPESRLCTIAMRFFVRKPNGVDDEFRETHLQFAYREDELREMLQRAGFTEIEAYQAYTLNPVHPASDRIFFVARRPPD